MWISQYQIQFVPTIVILYCILLGILICFTAHNVYMFQFHIHWQQIMALQWWMMAGQSPPLAGGDCHISPSRQVVQRSHNTRSTIGKVDVQPEQMEPVPSLANPNVHNSVRRALQICRTLCGLWKHQSQELALLHSVHDDKEARIARHDMVVKLILSRFNGVYGANLSRTSALQTKSWWPNRTFGHCSAQRDHHVGRHRLEIRAKGGTGAGVQNPLRPVALGCSRGIHSSRGHGWPGSHGRQHQCHHRDPDHNCCRHPTVEV